MSSDNNGDKSTMDYKGNGKDAFTKEHITELDGAVAQKMVKEELAKS